MFNHFKKRHLIWIGALALGSSTGIALGATISTNQIATINTNHQAANLASGRMINQIQETTINQTKIIIDDVFANYSAIQFANEKMIKEYVLNHMSKFFISVPEDNTLDNIIIRDINISNDKSSLTASVNLNRYYNNEPAIVNGIIGSTFTFTGFLVTGLNTELKSNVININEKNEEIQLIAGDFRDNLSNPIVINKIIELGLIINLPSSITLYSQDIVLQNPTNVDNENGSIFVEVVIKNNKAWTDGAIVPEKNLGILKIEGFKKLSKDVTTQTLNVLSFNDELVREIWSPISQNKFYEIDWLQEIDNHNNLYVQALKNYLPGNIDKFIKVPIINDIKVTLSTDEDFVLMTRSSLDNAVDLKIKFNNCITDPFTNIGRTKTFTYTLLLKETPMIQWTDIYNKNKLDSLHKKLEGKIGVSSLNIAASDIASNINKYLNENIQNLPNVFYGTSITANEVYNNLRIVDDILYIDTLNSTIKFSNNLIISFEGFSYQIVNKQSTSAVNILNSTSWTPIILVASVLVTLIIIVTFILYFYRKCKRIARDYERF